MSYTPDIEDDAEVDISVFKQEEEEEDGPVGTEEHKGSDSEAEVEAGDEDEDEEDEDGEQFEIDELVEEDEGALEDDELNDTQPDTKVENDTIPQTDDYKPYDETSESESDSSDDESEDEYMSKVDNEKNGVYSKNTHSRGFKDL